MARGERQRESLAEKKGVLTRRQFLGVLAVGAVAPSFLTGRALYAQATPSADTIVIGTTVDPSSLDPITTRDIIGLQYGFMMYNRLLEYQTDEDNMPVLTPGLATEWVKNADGSYIFKLREEVTFHDGRPLTADDVVYSYNRAVTTRGAYTWFLTQHSAEGAAEAIDRFTVRITPFRPFAPFLQTLATPVASILNRELVESKGADFISERGDAGSGVYKFVSWNRNSSIQITRYKEYYGESARTRNVVRLIIPEPSTRILSLLNGDIDIARIPPKQVASVQDDPNIVVKNMPSWNIRYFIFNNAQGPFAGLEEGRLRRQAFAKALNYEAVIKNVYKGFAERFQGPIPKGMFGYPENPPLYQFNLGEADKMLKESGFPRDRTVRCYTVSGQPEDRDTALQLQSDLAKIGITLEVRELEWGNFLQRLANPESFDLLVLGYTPKYNDGDSYVTPLLDPNSNSNGSPQGGNLAYYDNSEVTELIQEAKVEIDQNKRLALYDRIIRLAFEDAPYIWIAQLGNVITYRGDRLRNVEEAYNPISSYSFPTQGKWHLWEKIG